MEKTVNHRAALSINSKVNIVALDSSVHTVYDTRIEDVRKDTILISAPSDKGVPMLIHKGMRVEISFMSSGGRYFFQSRVGGRVLSGQLTLYEVDIPDVIQKSEFREFFRISIMEKVRVYAVPAEVYDDVQRVYFDNAFCMDISGGGLRMISDKQYSGVQHVEIDFTETIPTLGKFYGTVVRLIPAPEDKYDIGIKFGNMRETDRDKIIKYVFKRQIELRQMARR